MAAFRAAGKMADRVPAQCRTKMEPGDVLFFAVSAAGSAAECARDNCGLLLLFVALALFSYAVYKSFLRPPIYVTEMTEVGFDHIPRGVDRALHITRAQSSKQLGKKLPPPYPNGWFVVAESRDLKVGKVVPVDALGLNLCVYRGEDGLARCVDAYCPHLGANLAIGGTVCGSCIECPFHQWRFGADGVCVSIPGVDADVPTGFCPSRSAQRYSSNFETFALVSVSATVPKGISIKTWRTMEVDGAVWIWYDAEGREPLWSVPEAAELKKWGFRGRNEFLVNAHIQEIPENGADIAHLNAIHSTSLLTDIGDKFPFLHNIIGRHIWSAEWSKGEEDHIATVDIVHKYVIMKFNTFTMKVTVMQIGPSHVRLRFNSPLGPILVSQSVTPLSALLQKVVNRIYSPTLNAPLGAWMVLGEAYQLKRDVAIWNSKRYVHSPTYVKTDRTIRAFRSWFMQFYSEKSIPLRQAMQNPLDW
ncbi:unnamed protein product, partial [Iphiclides podalirius]